RLAARFECAEFRFGWVVCVKARARDGPLARHSRAPRSRVRDALGRLLSFSPRSTCTLRVLRQSSTTQETKIVIFNCTIRPFLRERWGRAGQLFAAADARPFAGPALPRLVLRDAYASRATRSKAARGCAKE